MNSLVIAIAVALVWIFLCAVVEDLAERRGHDGTLWFLFALFCSPVLAFLVVRLLPSAADLIPMGYHRCPDCSGVVKIERAICPYCHRDLTRESGAEKKAA